MPAGGGDGRLLPTSFESAQRITAAKSLGYPRGISTKACQL